jgi:hypothetical protein
VLAKPVRAVDGGRCLIARPLATVTVLINEHIEVLIAIAVWLGRRPDDPDAFGVN